MKFRKKDFWTKNNIYESCIKTLPRKTLEEVVDGLFHNKRIFPYLDWKWPINSFFELKENFLLESEFLDKLKISNSIYKNLRDFIINNISKEERDILNLYGTYGDMASFPYDVDEKRESIIPKEFTIDTILGKLDFKFGDHRQYNVSDDILLAYDDEKNYIILFVNDKDSIKTEDLINILRKHYRFIHELTHFIDKINENLEQFNYTNDIEYLNSPNEVRANIQMLIYCFGRYLFKNHNNILNYNLKNERDIDFLFKKFLNDTSKNNVVDEDDLEMMRKEEYYMYPENKKKLYDSLHKYIIDEYGTDDDINYKESHTKENMIRLLRLEEKVINEI